MRLEAELPNETWQSDFTHIYLADGSDTETITWLDDHSRYAVHVSAHRRITGNIVRDTFDQTAETHGFQRRCSPTTVRNPKGSRLHGSLRRLPGRTKPDRDPPG